MTRVRRADVQGRGANEGTAPSVSHLSASGERESASPGRVGTGGP